MYPGIYNKVNPRRGGKKPRETLHFFKPAQPGQAHKPGESEYNMKNNTTNTTVKATAHNPGTYYGKVSISRYACYIPGTCEKPGLLSEKTTAHKPVKSEIKPATVNPGNITAKPGKAPEKPGNAPETTKKSPAALMNSKPNTETNKPGKREQARINAAAFIEVLNEITTPENRNLIDYSDRIAGLYRLQVIIDGKMKTIARVKLQQDVYILVRENVAKELQFDYDLINYNLPAGTHFDYTAARDAIERLYGLFED